MPSQLAKIYPIKGHFMERDTERSIETLKEFHRVLRRSLRPPVYSVFCAIEDHAGMNPPPGIPLYTCFASETTLANEARVSRETVIRAIKELAGIKLLTIEDREGYTKLLWPLVTNEAYIKFMAEQEARDLLKSDTCNTKPQGVCQKATGGVSESHTNETNITKPNNETNKVMAVSSEPGPTTIDLPDCLPIENLSTAYSSRQEATTPGPTSTNQDRGDVRSHIPPLSTPKPKLKAVPKPGKPKDKKDENPFTKDPRLKIWKQIAEGEGYKYWPTRESQKLVYDHIPPSQVIRWEATIRAWLRKNHKVHNIEGMVKVFWFGFDAFYKGDADKRPLPVVEQIAESELVHAST